MRRFLALAEMEEWALDLFYFLSPETVKALDETHVGWYLKTVAARPWPKIPDIRSRCKPQELQCAPGDGFQGVWVEAGGPWESEVTLVVSVHRVQLQYKGTAQERVWGPTGGVPHICSVDWHRGSYVSPGQGHPKLEKMLSGTHSVAHTALELEITQGQ